MKFLVLNYSCLQIRGLPSPDPHSLRPLPSTEFVEPPTPPKKNPGYAVGNLGRCCSSSFLLDFEFSYIYLLPNGLR